MLSVGNGVADHVLEEDLEDATSLLVDEAADALHSATPREPSDSGLGDALDVVPQYLTVPFRTSLSQSLASLPSSRHLLLLLLSILRLGFCGENCGED